MSEYCLGTTCRMMEYKIMPQYFAIHTIKWIWMVINYIYLIIPYLDLLFNRKTADKHACRINSLVYKVLTIWSTLKAVAISPWDVGIKDKIGQDYTNVPHRFIVKMSLLFLEISSSCQRHYKRRNLEVVRYMWSYLNVRNF